MKIPNKLYRIAVNMLARSIRTLMASNEIDGHFCIGAKSTFFEFDGLRLAYHYSVFGVGSNIDSGGSSEPMTRKKLREFLGPGSVFYDLGAHEGLFSLDAKQRSVNVIAFEPQARNLRENIELDNAGDIVVHETAVGDRAGSVSMTVDQRSSNFVTADDGTIPLVRLDDLALPPPTAIKIDIEGFELNALRGARGILAQHRPVVITEINHCFKRYNRSLGPLYELMASCCYSLNRLSETGDLREIIERPDLPENLPLSGEEHYWWLAKAV